MLLSLMAYGLSGSQNGKMIGILGGLKMAFFGIIAAAVIGGWLYVKGLQKDLAIQKKICLNLSKLIKLNKK